MNFLRYFLVTISRLFRKDLVLFCETHHGSGSNVYALYTSWSLDPSFPFRCKLVSRDKKDLRNRLRYESLLLKARWIVQDHGGRAWYPGQQVIELWHGIPLKVMDWMDTNQELSRDAIESRKNIPDVVLSSSRLYETLLSACRFIPANRYRRFGYPRLKWFRTNRATARRNLSLVLGREILENERILLWMPTHRNLKSDGNHNGASRVPSLLDSYLTPGFERILQQNDAILLMKPHPNDEPLVQGRVDNLGSRVRLLTSDAYSTVVDDLYCLLPATDALITDYSSVFIDYLVLDKPIAFVVDDIDVYRRNRGFLLEPVERWMPGAPIQSLDALKDFVAQVATGEDAHATQRKELRTTFFPQGIQDSAALLKEHILGEQPPKRGSR